MTIFATHDPSTEKMVEKAIIYLVDAIKSTGHNPKPVILHSVRVGLYLYNQNYNQDIVLAAILHDILEDTEIKNENIEREFGSKIVKLISANSINNGIFDKYERDIEMLNRCKDEGKSALLIKAADILDNSYYYYFCENEAQYRKLLKKMEYFLEISSNELSKEPVWICLKQRFDELDQSSGIKK